MQLSEHENANLPIKRFEEMLKTDSIFFFDTIEFENIIEHYINLAKIPLAKKAIKIGLEQHQNNTSIMLFQVEVLVMDNELDEADLLLQDIKNIDSNNDEVYIQEANILSKRNKHLEAIKALKKGLEHTSEPSDIYNLMGMEFLLLENYRGAKKCYKLCLENDSEDYSALYNIIYCYEILEQHNKAIKFLTSYLDVQPYSEIGWHQLGRQYIAKKRYKKALQAFEFSVYSDDTFIGAYFERAKVLEKLERYEEAIENYQTTLTLEDPTAFAHLRIGKCYEKLNQHQNAIQYYFKAIHEDPSLDKAWISIIDFYTNTGDLESAINFSKKAIGIDSSNIAFLRRYAYLNIKINNTEQAEQTFNKLIELGEFELDIWTNRSDLLLKLDDMESAIQTLLQGLALHPENPEIEYRLAGLYYKTNEASNGQYHLINALGKDKGLSYIFKEIFSDIYQRASIKELIDNYLEK